MKTQGMTVVELMTVLFISALLLLIMVPALTRLYYRLEALRIISEVYTVCLHARAEAATSRLPQVICGSSNGEVCDHNWSKGILYFSDENHSNNREAGEKQAKYLSLDLGKSTLNWSGFGGKTLRVEAFGIPFASNGSFTYCPGNKDSHLNRQVIVNRSGRVRPSRDTNGDGIHESAAGSNISCP